MSPYRSPILQRQAAQTTEVMKYAGFTATWYQFISASAGVSVAGFGSAPSYRQQVITAMLGSIMNNIVTPNTQKQTQMGMAAAGSLRIKTTQRLSKDDEFVWNGVRYRVDADSQPSQLDGFWLSVLNRGSN